MKLERTAEQGAEEDAIRRQHAANPIRQRPSDVVDSKSFAATLDLISRSRTAGESRGLTLAEVADRMGIDAPALSRLETGKMLNPTLTWLAGRASDGHESGSGWALQNGGRRLQPIIAISFAQYIFMKDRME